MSNDSLELKYGPHHFYKRTRRTKKPKQKNSPKQNNYSSYDSKQDFVEYKKFYLDDHVLSSILLKAFSLKNYFNIIIHFITCHHLTIVIDVAVVVVSEFNY